MKLYPGVIAVLCIGSALVMFNGCTKSSTPNETPKASSSATQSNGSSGATSSPAATTPTTPSTTAPSGAPNVQGGGAGSTADIIKKGGPDTSADTGSARIPAQAPKLKGSFPKPGQKF